MTLLFASSRVHVENSLDTTDQQPMSVVQPSRSRLLRLPGELRNRIYKYALAADQILQYFEPKGREKGRLIEPNADSDFNQMKYACRQLYSETAGLEIKYSSVGFLGEYPTAKVPAQRFGTFFATLNPSRASWLSEVILFADPVPYDVEPAQNLLPLANFCRANPHARVEYIDGKFNMKRSLYHFHHRGAYLSVAIRKASPFPILRAKYVLTAQSWTDAQGAVMLDVPNLRFWPAERLAARKDAQRLEPSPRVRHGLHFQPELREMVESWLEHGI